MKIFNMNQIINDNTKEFFSGFVKYIDILII